MEKSMLPLPTDRARIGRFLPIKFACLVAFALPTASGWIGPWGIATVSAQPPGYEEQMEQRYDSDYGSDPYYDGGYSSGSRSMSSGSDVTNTYASSLIGLATGIDLTPVLVPETEVVVEVGPVLSREAEQAFAAGHLGMAVELMCGHMVTEYDEATSAIASVKFSPALRRPVWNVRWGVSIAVRGSENVSEPNPLREGTTTPGRRLASSGGGGGGGYDEGYSDSSGGPSESDMSGYDEQMGGPTMARPKPTTVTVRSMLDEEANTILDKNLGLVAEIIATEFQSRFAKGDYGPLFTSTTTPEPATPQTPNARTTNSRTVSPAGVTVSESLDASLNDAPEWMGMWKPGLTFVGSGPSEEMLSAAKSEGLDFLLHFDVLLKPGRNDETQNVSRCRLFSLATGKQMALSKSIDTTEAAQMISTNRASSETAYVKDQLAALFGVIDRTTKVTAMPAGLTADAARRRVGMLVSGRDARSLKTLAEIRLYQSLDLLTADEVEAAFDIVGGPDALMLLHGPIDERLEMARTWAVRAQPGGKK
jgi:hypothetical protein